VIRDRASVTDRSQFNRDRPKPCRSSLTGQSERQGNGSVTAKTAQLERTRGEFRPGGETRRGSAQTQEMRRLALHCSAEGPCCERARQAVGCRATGSQVSVARRWCIAVNQLASIVPGVGHSPGHPVTTPVPPPCCRHRGSCDRRDYAVLLPGHTVASFAALHSAILSRTILTMKRQHQGHSCPSSPRCAAAAPPVATHRGAGTQSAHSNCGDRRSPIAARNRAQPDRSAAGRPCVRPRCPTGRSCRC
jgi:hypothetical protein